MRLKKTGTQTNMKRQTMRHTEKDERQSKCREQTDRDVRTVRLIDCNCASVVAA